MTGKRQATGDRRRATGDWRFRIASALLLALMASPAVARADDPDTKAEPVEKAEPEKPDEKKPDDKKKADAKKVESTKEPGDPDNVFPFVRPLPGTKVKALRKGIETWELPLGGIFGVQGVFIANLESRPIASVTLVGEKKRWWDKPEILERTVADELGDRWFFTPVACTGPKARDDAACRERRKRQPSSAERLDALFGLLGYEHKLATRNGPDGIAVTLTLAPIHFVRIVRIYGNWPLFEDEIKRRLRLRGGLRLPPPGPQRDSDFEQEKARITSYLKGEGFFEATAKIEVKPLDHPGQVKLVVTVQLGRTYRYGKLHKEGNKAFDDETIDDIMLPKWHERDWAPPFQEFQHLASLDLTSATGTLGTLKKLGPPIPGWNREAFSIERLNQRVANLRKEYQRRGYAAVRVSVDFDETKSIDKKGGVVNLNLRIREGKKLEVGFRGNGKLTDDELKKVLVFNLLNSYDDVTIDENARAVQNVYQQNGYFLAQVRGKVVESTDALERVEFSIVEGPEMRVKKVDFRGNDKVKKEELASVVETRGYPPLGTIGLGEGGYTTSAQIERDVELIKTTYKVQGFAEAEADGDLAPDEEALDRAGVLAALEATVRRPDSLYVRYSVEEGDRKTVGSMVIAFRGDKHHFDGETLLRRMAMRPGQTYTKDAFDKDRGTIERAYKEIGYREARVEGILQADEDEDPFSLRVLWTIDEGKPVKIGEVLIRGNYHTSERVLRREIDLRRGDLYEESRVERMTNNLRATGLFSAVRLAFLPASSDPQTVHIVIDVEERYDDYGTVELGGGYATDALGYVTAGYLNRNIFGGAYLLEARGTYGQRLWEISTAFVWSRFLNSRFRLELKGEARSEETQRLGLIQTQQVITTLKREVLPRANLFLQWTLRQVTRPEDLVRPAGPSDDQQRFNTQTFVSSIGPGFDLDRRDNPLLPRRGYRATIITAYADPNLWISGDSAKFFRVSATAQGYVPLGGQIALAQGMRYDHGFPLGGAVLLPKTERFFAGGDTTVRGYEADMLRTEDTCIELPGAGDPCLQRVRRPAGGNIRLIYNFEIEFPWLASKSVPIKSALFFDTGLVVDSYAGFSLRSFRHAAGFAPVRVGLPIGFLSFEYAFPLDPEPGDDPTGRFHFNFGFVF